MADFPPPVSATAQPPITAILVIVLSEFPGSRPVAVLLSVVLVVPLTLANMQSICGPIDAATVSENQMWR